MLLAELVDENPFAIRAVLKILEVEFTERVPTMAVTREQRPRLLVNLAFVKEHCATDDHVKAVICHEFLHVLLCHTEDKRPLTPARHLAFDAVINAIIHRTFGPSFSSMMSQLLRGRGRYPAHPAADEQRGTAMEREVPEHASGLGAGLGGALCGIAGRRRHRGAGGAAGEGGR